MKAEIRIVASILFGKEDFDQAIICMQEFEDEFSKTWKDDSGGELYRIEAAILKSCEDKPRDLQAVLKLAKTDYRDLLVGAGFGDDVDVHLKWVEEKMKLDHFEKASK